MASPALVPTSFPTTISSADPAMLAQAAAATNFKQFIQSAAQQFGFQSCSNLRHRVPRVGLGPALETAWSGWNGRFRTTKKYQAVSSRSPASRWRRVRKRFNAD